MEIVSTNPRTEIKAYEPVVFEFSSLTPIEKKVYENSLMPKLATYNAISKLALANEICLEAGRMLRTNVNGEDSEVLQSKIEENLDKFNSLSRDEVLYFTNKGLSGDYLGNDSFVFFNPSNWVIWGKRYMEDERNKLLSKVNLAKKVEPGKPKPTDAEMKAEAIAIANSYVRKVTVAENKESVYQWAGGLNFLYDVANEHKLIPFTGPRKLEILALCNNDIDLAKSETYKLWITEMAENGCTLDEQGEMI